MNKVVLLGRLTKDVEIKYTQSGKVVASFTLAVDRPFAGQDGKKEADFINCQIWGKSAETLGNSGVHKGQRLLVEGRLQIRQYEDKQGAKRWITEVVCDRFEYIEKREQVQQAAANDFDSMGQAVPFDDNIPF